MLEDKMLEERIMLEVKSLDENHWKKEYCWKIKCCRRILEERNVVR